VWYLKIISERGKEAEIPIVATRGRGRGGRKEREFSS